MATGLTSFVQQKRDSYAALEQQAQEDFSSANQSLSLALENYESIIEQTAELDDSIASTRKQMAAENNLPADIDALTEELQTMLIERRHLTANLANADEEVNNAKLLIEFHQADMTQFGETLRQAEDELERAEIRQEQHTAWTASELETEISVVRDTATALLSDSFVPVPDEINPAEILADAKTRVENDIPEVLLARARVRAGFIDDKLTATQSLQDSVSNSAVSHISINNGSTGFVDKRWTEYEIAEDNLKTYALTSVNQYEHAINLLSSVLESTDLTIAESDAIAAASLAVDSTAITTEETLHAARAAVIAKQFDYELAIIAARMDDVNADPLDDINVQNAAADLGILNADLEAAELAHTDELALEIDIWESTVPNYIWANLQAYDTAIAILTTLSSSDGVVLQSEFDTAESNLVITLTDDDNIQKLTNVLFASSDLAGQKTNYVENVQSSVSLSGMRGDY